MKTLLLNCAILTGGQGTYEFVPTTIKEAKKEIAENGFLSAIGHSATAEVLSTLLGQEIPANRIQAKQEQGQVALVFSLGKRIEEGRILNKKEIEEIGYNLFFLIKK